MYPRDWPQCPLWFPKLWKKIRNCPGSLNPTPFLFQSCSSVLQICSTRDLYKVQSASSLLNLLTDTPKQVSSLSYFLRNRTFVASSSNEQWLPLTRYLLIGKALLRWLIFANFANFWLICRNKPSWKIYEMAIREMKSLRKKPSRMAIFLGIMITIIWESPGFFCQLPFYLELGIWLWSQ